MTMRPNPQTASPARRLLVALTVLLTFAHPLMLLADTPLLADAPLLTAPVPSVAAAAPEMLEIEILDGEGALNNIRQRTAREPIVEVRDENHKPVAGALVLLTIQPGGGGAAATFSGSLSTSLYTDASGRAVVHGLIPNSRTGKFTIAVTATVGTLVAYSIIHQKNVRGAWPPQPDGKPGHGPRGFRSGKFDTILIGAVTVAVILTVVLLTRGHGTSITAGAGTVGVP